MEMNDRQWQAIDAEICAGRKIDAIKLYREGTGEGLKEAKDAVEARERVLRETSPGRFTAPAKSGCMSVLLLGLAMLWLWKTLA